MDAPNREFVLAGSLEELKAKGRLVLHGSHRRVYDRGHVFALDNRCPHMGAATYFGDADAEYELGRELTMHGLRDDEPEVVGEAIRKPLTMSRARTRSATKIFDLLLS